MEALIDDHLNLDNLSIMLLDGGRETLCREFSKDELADLFVDRWIPYLVCRDDCGRHSYCRFAQPDSSRSGRSPDIRCGFAVEVVRNFVGSSFHIARSLEASQLQGYLDGAYHLVRFVHESELRTGLMISQDYLSWLAEDRYKVKAFTSVVDLRERLDAVAASLGNIQAFATTRTLILVEGLSELRFLQRLAQTGLVWWTGLRLDSYEGRSNRRPTTLRLLKRRMQKAGYDVFIQGDADGRVVDIFDQLVLQEIVSRDNTFRFRVDFETSFPTDMLYDALRHMDRLEHVDRDTFVWKIRNDRSESVLGQIRKAFDIDLEPCKVHLAEALGDVLNQDFLLWSSDEFWQSEIGQFLDRIRRLP
jgi:hypothetical protein